jgi:hypothetical protein
MRRMAAHSSRELRDSRRHGAGPVADDLRSLAGFERGSSLPPGCAATREFAIAEGEAWKRELKAKGRMIIQKAVVD